MKEIVIEGWVQYHSDYEEVAEELGYEGTTVTLYKCLDEALFERIMKDNISEPEGSKKWKAVRARLIVLVED